MILPRYPDFRPLGLEDQAVFNEYFERETSGVCELNFANLFIWADSERPRWTTLDGSLCILVEPGCEPPYALPPVGGDRIPETMTACLRHVPRLARIPEDFVRKYGACFRIEEDPSNFDYIYRVEDLAELRGKRYDGKRNRIRKFESTFPSTAQAAIRAPSPGGCCSSHCADRITTAMIMWPLQRRAAQPWRWSSVNCRCQSRRSSWPTPMPRLAIWAPPGASISACRWWLSQEATARPPPRR